MTRNRLERAWVYSSAATVLAILVAVSVLSGCLLNPYSGCRNNLMQKEWTETDLYDEMPPNGTYGQYTVFRGHSFEGEGQEGLERVVALSQTSEEDVRLEVYQSDAVVYEIVSNRRHSDADTGEILRALYSDLGLGEPGLQDWSFDWDEIGC